MSIIDSGHDPRATRENIAALKLKRQTAYGGGLPTVDALGNPTGFHLTPGQAHDLEGADALLPGLEADALLADKAYDADERVIEPLRDAGIEPVIPAKANRKQPRPYDKDLYKARSLIENFFCKLKQFRAIATRYDKTARNFLAAIQLAAAVVWLNWGKRPKRAKMHGKEPLFRSESRRLTARRSDFGDFGGFIACNDCVQLRLAGMLTARGHNCTQ